VGDAWASQSQSLIEQKKNNVATVRVVTLGEHSTGPHPLIPFLFSRSTAMGRGRDRGVEAAQRMTM